MEEVHPDWVPGSLAGLVVGTLHEPGSSLLPVLLGGSRYGSQLGLDLEMASHCPVCWVPLSRREAAVSDLAKSGRGILRSAVVMQVLAASPAG